MRNLIMLLLLLLTMAMVAAPVAAQSGGDTGDVIETEQPTEVNLRVYTDLIDSVVLPVLAFMARAVNAVTNLQTTTCGQVSASFVPFGPASAPVQLTASNSFPETMRGIGQAMGTPIAYVRALNARYDIEYGPVTLIVGFILAGITFEVVVIIILYTVRAVKSVVAFFIGLYKLIPFKST